MLVKRNARLGFLRNGHFVTVKEATNSELGISWYELPVYEVEFGDEIYYLTPQQFIEQRLLDCGCKLVNSEPRIYLNDDAKEEIFGRDRMEGENLRIFWDRFECEFGLDEADKNNAKKLGIWCCIKMTPERRFAI